jgi:hypothetical protein
MFAQQDIQTTNTLICVSYLQLFSFLLVITSANRAQFSVKFFLVSSDLTLGTTAKFRNEEIKHGNVNTSACPIMTERVLICSHRTLFFYGQRNVPCAAVLCLTLFLTQVSMLLRNLCFFIFTDVFCACYPFIEWFYKFCFCDKLKTLNHQNTNYLAAHFLLLTYSVYWPWPQIFGINNAESPQG